MYRNKVEMNFSWTFIALQIKLISIWKIAHQDSFRNSGKTASQKWLIVSL